MKITRLALAAKWGALGVRGLPAAQACSVHMAAKATEPNPQPDVRKNSRRERILPADRLTMDVIRGTEIRSRQKPRGSTGSRLPDAGRREARLKQPAPPESFAQTLEHGSLLLSTPGGLASS